MKAPCKLLEKGNFFRFAEGLCTTFSRTKLCGSKSVYSFQKRRKFTEYLQVSRSTVDLAYEQLSSEGYIEARPYKGYYICHVDGLFHMENEVENSISQNEVKTPVDYDFSPHGIDMN